MWIWLRGPAQLAVGDGVLFLGEPGEIALLWAFACALGLVFWRWRARGFLALLAGLAALALAWVLLADTLRLSRAETVRLAQVPAGLEAGPKTLLVGVDALSWNRLLPLVERGKLPNLERLIRNGSYGVLHSLQTRRESVGRTGYWSPVIWTSIATGVGVDKHGIDDFHVYEQERKTLAASHHRRVPAFWNIFSAFGKTVGVVGWWASWPAEQVEGVMASSGLGLRGDRGPRRAARKGGSPQLQALTWPPEFEHVVEEVGPPSDIERFIDQNLFPISSYPILAARERKTLESVITQDRLYYQLTRYLLEHEDLDLYATYLEGIDLAGHLFWDLPPDLHSQRFAEDPNLRYGVLAPDGFDEHTYLVERYYGLVDRWIGSLVRRAGENAAVVVCSDHGFRSDPSHAPEAGHSGHGVLIVKGPGVRAGHDLNLTLGGSVADLLRGRVTVLDVLPTLLYMHGLPISDELDGRVLYRLFERSYLKRRPEVRVAEYTDLGAAPGVEVEVTPEIEEEHLRRLRSLGYLD